jgi:hypothetical protein
MNMDGVMVNGVMVDGVMVAGGDGRIDNKRNINFARE